MKDFKSSGGKVLNENLGGYNRGHFNLELIRTLARKRLELEWEILRDYYTQFGNGQMLNIINAKK